MVNKKNKYCCENLYYITVGGKDYTVSPIKDYAIELNVDVQMLMYALDYDIVKTRNIVTDYDVNDKLIEVRFLEEQPKGYNEVVEISAYNIQNYMVRELGEVIDNLFDYLEPENEGVKQRHILSVLRSINQRYNILRE